MLGAAQAENSPKRAHTRNSNNEPTQLAKHTHKNKLKATHTHITSTEETHETNSQNILAKTYISKKHKVHSHKLSHKSELAKEQAQKANSPKVN